MIEPVDSCLRTVTGEHAPIHGRGQLQLGIGSLVLPQELWVADIHDECILGLDFLQAHSCQVNLKDGSLVIGEEEIPLRKSKASKEPNCYKAVLTEGVCLLPLAETVVPVRVDGAQADYRWGLLEQPTSSFDDLLVARTLVDLQRKEVPLRQPVRRLPLAKREEAEKAVQEMREQDVIEPSASPWSSPIVLVNKKDGSIRFCVDYRKFNITHKDSYPLPRIDDTIEALSGAKFFSTLDLKSGYWQVPLDDSAKEKTAFSTGSGLWQFNVMPFGLCNAPATFERLMEQVLFGLPMSVALVYLDDIIVPGQSFSQHIANLQQVFERLRKAKLKLSPKKCILFQRKVQYLGHVVSEEGISPDPGKIEAVKTWPRPATVTEIKSFLGLCSYYRRVVPVFAEIAHPLSQCATTSPFSWTPEAEDAFIRLKQALTETPVLVYPDPATLFILDTDASGTGIGGVLSQKCLEEERVIAYFSRALSAQECRYCVTRRELLAVVKAIKHFHAYLYGRKFIRWIEGLQQYDFTIEHRPGVKHGNADALSRWPCWRDSCKHCERLESQEELKVSTEPGATVQTQYTSTQMLSDHCDKSVTEEQAPAKPPDTHASFQIFHVAALDLLTGTAGRQVQLSDQDLKPVLEWMERSSHRPPWEEIAPHNDNTKVYCAQWQSLRVFNGVVSPLGDSFWRYHCQAADTSKITTKDWSFTTAARYPNGWTLRSC